MQQQQQQLPEQLTARKASLLEQIEALVEPSHEACDRVIATQSARITALEEQLELARKQTASGLQPGALSIREREVLRLVAHGRGTGDIAKSLWISPATVRNHLQSIYTKLDAHSRIEAVNLARAKGYIPLAGAPGDP